MFVTMASAAAAFAVLDFILDDTDADIWHDLESTDSSSSEDESGEYESADTTSDVAPTTKRLNQGDDPLDFLRTIEAYSDEEFKSNFRVNRSTASVLIEMYLQAYEVPAGGGGRKRIGYTKEVYLFLWYLSSQMTFVQISDMFRVSRSAAYNVVVRVSTWIVSIGHEFITWPEGEELNRVEFGFYHKNLIAGIIGAIDCTHFQIKRPHENYAQYKKKSKFYSLILQAVVDTDLMFRDIHCGEPGSMDNRSVLAKSQLYNEAMQSHNEMFPNNTFIIGSSAYPNTQWLVAPYPDNGLLGDQQIAFNDIQSSTRKVVGQAFAMLQQRFQRIKNLTEQRNTNFVINIIVSGCVMQNICILQNDHFEMVNIKSEAGDDGVEEYVCEEEDFERTSRRDELFSDLIEQNII